VGGPTLLRERALEPPAELGAWIDGWKDRGASVLYLVRGREVIGGLALEDEIRPEARAAVAELQAMGRRVVLITGDARQVADAVAADLGLDEVLPRCSPRTRPPRSPSCRRGG
jgi:Cu2+-exporting ATPase